MTGFESGGIYTPLPITHLVKLKDVVVKDVKQGQELTYNASNKMWINTPASGGNENLSQTLAIGNSAGGQSMIDLGTLNFALSTNSINGNGNDVDILVGGINALTIENDVDTPSVFNFSSQSATLIPATPDSNDTFLGTATNPECHDIVKLSRGTLNRLTIPVGSQTNFGTSFGFPTGMPVNRIRQRPISSPACIIGRSPAVNLAPSATTVVQYGNQVLGRDNMYYDPCNMRAAMTFVNWTQFAAPMPFNALNGEQGQMLIKVFCQGSWSGGTSGNTMKIYARQYSVGVFVRNLIVHQFGPFPRTTNQSGERRILGLIAGETFNVNRDTFDIVFENISTSTDDFDLEIGQVEAWYESYC
jgi:hypothetical protein